MIPLISSTTMRYLQILERKENPMNVTRVISKERKSAFVELPSVSGSENNYEGEISLNSAPQFPVSLLLENSPAKESSFLQGQPAKESTSYECSIRDSEFFSNFEPRQASSNFLEKDLFKSPPVKRRKQSFVMFESGVFETSSAMAALSLDFNEKINHRMATQAIFGDSSMIPDFTVEPIVVDSDNNNSFKFVLTEKEEMAQESQSALLDQDDCELVGSVIDETMMPSRCLNRILEKTFMERKKLNVNTFYKNRVITETTQNVIDNYYKVQRPNDWNAVVEGLVDMMEPSLDYLHAKIAVDKNVSLGCNQQEICDEEAYNCEDISESLEQIEQSFNLPHVSLVSSTPKENRSKSHNETCSTIISNLVDSDNDTEQQNTDVGDSRSVIQSISKLLAVSRTKENSEDIALNFNISNFDIEKFMDSSDGKILAEKPVDAPVMGFLENEIILSDIPDEPNIVEIQDSEHQSQAMQVLSQHNPILADARKLAILSQIEGIFKKLLEALVKQKPMVLKVRKVKDWADCELNKDVLSQKETCIGTRSISFNSKSSERTFTIVIVVLCEVYKMLQRNLTCTKRELYYRDMELFRKQDDVNKAVDTICAMLNVQEFELGIISSSKGLVAGALKIIIGDEIIDCATPRAVPSNPSAITGIESDAAYVLIVEKDTVFQRFINENIFDRIETKIILITAKGYPDVNTRVLLKKLSTATTIPIYVLVDADPHGVEIMCTYKYGSMMKIHNSEHLAVPRIEWIGIHPSDIELLDVTNVELTPAEMKKVDELLQRPYANTLLRRELNVFKARRAKAEIENIYHYSIDFLINDFIPRKIRSIEMPAMP